MATNTIKNRALKLVKEMLVHRRNGHVIKEQKAYEAIEAFCDDNNLDMDNVITGATKELRKSIANQINGFC